MGKRQIQRMERCAQTAISTVLRMSCAVLLTTTSSRSHITRGQFAHAVLHAHSQQLRITSSTTELAAEADFSTFSLVSALADFTLSHMSRLPLPTAVALYPAEEESPDVEVTAVDQLYINEFGRLNARKHELRDAAAAARTREAELGDAEEGILLADESAPGALKIAVGIGLFVDCDAAAATMLIEQRRVRSAASVAAAEVELRDIASRQSELKALLYTKFGRSINLEDVETSSTGGA